MDPKSKVSLKPFQRLAGRGQQCQQLKQLRQTVNCFAIHLGAPSIAGRPSPKNDPPDRFIGFTPAELLKQGNFALCGVRPKGAALWKPASF